MINIVYTSDGKKYSVSAQSATRYLWTKESERCRCQHSVEVHKTILKQPFVAVCEGKFSNSNSRCKCQEFKPYRYAWEDEDGRLI